MSFRIVDKAEIQTTVLWSEKTAQIPPVERDSFSNRRLVVIVQLHLAQAQFGCTCVPNKMTTKCHTVFKSCLTLGVSKKCRRRQDTATKTQSPVGDVPAEGSSHERGQVTIPLFCLPSKEEINLSKCGSGSRRGPFEWISTPPSV